MAEVALEADVGTIEITIDFEGTVPLAEFSIFLLELEAFAQISTSLAGARLEIAEMRMGSLKAILVARFTGLAAMGAAAVATMSVAEKPLGYLADSAQIAQFIGELAGIFADKPAEAKPADTDAPPAPVPLVQVVQAGWTLTRSDGVHSLRIEGTGAAVIRLNDDGISIDTPDVAPRPNPVQPVRTWASTNQKQGKSRRKVSDEWRQRAEAGLPLGFRLRSNGEVEIETEINVDGSGTAFVLDQSGGRIDLIDFRHRPPESPIGVKLKIVGRLNKMHGGLKLGITRIESDAG